MNNNLDNPNNRIVWWQGLEMQWKNAFIQLTKEKNPNNELPQEQWLKELTERKVFRFIGPEGTHPNLDFELSNLSGLSQLGNIEILICGYAQLTSLKEISALTDLKSLFVHCNRLKSLKGIEKLEKIEQLYVNSNRIKSLKPLKNLTRLHTLYCNYNRLKSLDGLTKAHRKKLKNLYVLPNETLSKKAIKRMEQKIKINCLSAGF